MAPASINRALRTIKRKAVLAKRRLSEDRSPVPHLLLSNEPPTDEERIVVEHAVAEIRARIALLDEKLKHRPRNQLLRWRRARLADFLKAHERVLAPWKRLPFELLMEIFSHFTLPAPTEVSISTHVFVSPQPGICRRVELRKKTLHPKYIAMLNRHLEWSMGAPLRVTITSSHRDYPESHPALEAVLVHASRWELLHAEISLPALKPFEKIRGQLSGLRFLTLGTSAYDRVTSALVDAGLVAAPRIPSGRPFALFEGALNLRCVDIRGFLPEGMVLPWGNLEAYKENVNNVGGMKNFVTGYPRLKHLAIDDNVGVAWDGIVTLPYLKTLEFNYNHWSEVDGDIAINHLVLPALEDAAFTGLSAGLVPAVRSLLVRSACDNLQRLMFLPATTLPGQLSELLELTPNLVGLKCGPVPNQDLERLVGHLANRPLVLALQRLRVYMRGSSVGMLGDENLYRTLANNRCNLPNNGGNTSPGVLRELRITARCIVDNVQSTLEGWSADVPQPSSVQEPIRLKYMLLTFWPRLDDGYDIYPLHTPGWKKKALDLDSKSAERLNGIFLDVEKMPVTSCRDLHVSRIHFVLKRITQLPPNRIPSEKKYRFRKRAELILQQWQPFFTRCVESMHWVKVGRHSVVYIPDGDALRIQHDAAEKFVYGFEDADLDCARSRGN
ncbi:hypothetical protein BKA70DRAFT_1563805 [Coprinopsis sp. MPI-PUGE-AT-0042]|nr:hypothetical protein BKA70DRAFT_1563805 [Coprinopsis sp. MPI-PUGE-AT-0042]